MQIMGMIMSTAQVCSLPVVVVAGLNVAVVVVTTDVGVVVEFDAAVAMADTGVAVKVGLDNA